jgi:hypothetical protein
MIKLGGDFNMIRFPWEKSSGNINHFWMNAFMNSLGIMGLKRWTEKVVNLHGQTSKPLP